MRHVKLAVWFLLYCASTVATACPTNGDVESFLKFRSKFIEASLQGNAEAVVDFYHFPLIGSGLMENDKNLKISRKTFIKLYRVLFVETSRNGAPTIFKNLGENKEIGSSVLKNMALPNGCIKERNLKNGILEPDYSYQLIDGTWKVTRVSIADGYDDAIDELKSRKIKPW